MNFKDIKTSKYTHFIVSFEVIDYGTKIHKALLTRKQTLKFKNISFLIYPTKYDYIGLSFLSCLPSINEEKDKELNTSFISNKLVHLLN